MIVSQSLQYKLKGIETVYFHSVMKFFMRELLKNFEDSPNDEFEWIIGWWLSNKSFSHFYKSQRQISDVLLHFIKGSVGIKCCLFLGLVNKFTHWGLVQLISALWKLWIQIYYENFQTERFLDFFYQFLECKQPRQFDLALSSHMLDGKISWQLCELKFMLRGIWINLG